MFGFLQDDWHSIAATIDYAIDLGSTVAQFKLLTPYPGTPMYRQLAPRIYEQDWERFDGYTPTFTHPILTADELPFLLGAAYNALLHAAVLRRDLLPGARPWPASGVVVRSAGRWRATSGRSAPR